jgi:hypothetical protein
VTFGRFGLAAEHVLFEQVIPGALPRLRGINVGRVGFTDSESFSRHGIPRISIHSITQRTFHNVDSFNDNFDVVQWKNYYDTYLLIAAYLACLDIKLE